MDFSHDENGLARSNAGRQVFYTFGNIISNYGDEYLHNYFWMKYKGIMQPGQINYGVNEMIDLLVINFSR